MKKIISLLIASLVLATAFMSAIPVSAKKVHKNCISIINPQQNLSGDGYDWLNYASTLTLDNLNIKTDDDYGLKICDGATVVLKGDNYIEAKKAAIFLEAKVLFKGSGTLTLVGENGIYCSSADNTDSLSIVGGTYKITSSGAGIISDFHRVSLSNCKITVKSEGGIAIKAQTVTTGAKTVIKANGSITGVDKLLIESSSITLNTSTKALISNKPVVFSNVTLKAGDSEKTLSSIDLKASGYDGQKCIKTVSLYDGQKKSLIFGDAVPRYVDVILLAAVIAVLGCAVVVPVVYKKKKAMIAIAKRDAEQSINKPSVKKRH